MSNLFVSIIIPTYKDWERLSLCLDALENQTYDQRDFEILVVNNNLQDNTPDNYHLPSNCKIMREGKPGSYAARNAAIGIAKGSIIGFTDSDCIPDLNWIKNAVSYFQANADVKRIGGRIVLFSKSDKPTRTELYDMVFAFPQKEYVNQVGIAVTANMFSYRSVFDAIGLFDSALLSGGDYQWGAKANNAGYKIDFVENVIINHPARPSLRDLIIKEKRVGQGQADFIPRKRTIMQSAYEVLHSFKPKVAEIKNVFNSKVNIGFLDKLWLVFLRHYLLWLRNYSKIKASVK